MLRSLVGSEMCIRDRSDSQHHEPTVPYHLYRKIRDEKEAFCSYYTHAISTRDETILRLKEESRQQAALQDHHLQEHLVEVEMREEMHTYYTTTLGRALREKCLLQEKISQLEHQLLLNRGLVSHEHTQSA
eukprot:TRINITY_DN12859_c0_g1_i4.p1 TRINITY_DN12859_c0_g1~~TRINITY_DN12859_c0_g1_i4.p1  ORF type:complete len:131 (-),score=36.76 TRINITY_DN12859_c0_g1_i4:790-1182(-)